MSWPISKGSELEQSVLLGSTNHSRFPTLTQIGKNRIIAFNLDEE